MPSLRRDGKISKEEHQQNIKDHNEVTRHRGGGIGIPGKRSYEHVMSFQPLDGKNIHGELKNILSTSRDIRSKRKEMTAEEKAQKALEANRLVASRIEPRRNTAHSLHVGNDIAAVYNGPTHGARVFSYAELAPAIDAKLALVEERNIKAGRLKKIRARAEKGKTYHDGKKKVGQRRNAVAKGLEQLLKGDVEKMTDILKNEGGLTTRGINAAARLGTILLAEQAREAEGGRGQGLVPAAVRNIAESSCTETFVSDAGKKAPFAKPNNANIFKS